MKHTPGPWKAWQPKPGDNSSRGPDFHWEVATDSPDRRQCVVQCVYSEANARLIAASPDMIDALRFAEQFITALSRRDLDSELAGNETNDAAREVLFQVQAAIAKAEGK